MKLHFTIALFLLFSIKIYSQLIQSVELTDWKNGCKGAYSIIHDDYCMYTSKGIAQYADTAAHNRGISISFAIVTGHCDDNEWNRANSMLQNGHEIHNHSHNHFCGLPVNWCPNDYYTSKNYAEEYNLSNDLILKYTKTKADFFVFPYDLINDTMINYLKDSLKLLGTRSGKQNSLNSPDSIENFGVRFNILRPEQKRTVLDSLAQSAINEGKWAVRGCHGVEDESWGSIPLNDYVAHLNFLQKKISSYDLWVETPVRILKYNRCKQNTLIKLNKDIIEIKNTSEYNEEKLTLEVNSNDKLTFYQADKQLKTVFRNNKYYINFFPNKGNILVVKL